MKIGYIGGGSFRVLSEVRVLLGHPALERAWDIALYDHDGERVAAMATLLRATPEVKRTGSRVVVAASLDEAVDGADFVEMTACPWSGSFYRRCGEVSQRHGLMTTDNVSITGAFLALHSGALALRVARRMETLAPNGLLICFTNPIAILAGAVNLGTRIRAIGICAGQVNYIHNVAYIMGWPEYNWDLEAEIGGINHMSWIMKLTLQGRDMLGPVREQLAAGVDYERLKDVGNVNELRIQFPRLAYAWEMFDALHSSIEPEGLPLLSFYEEECERQMSSMRPEPAAPVRPAPTGRPPRVKEFLRLAQGELNAEFWTTDCPAWLRPQPFKAHAGARVIKGLASPEAEIVTTSYRNQGAIEGFGDDAIMEYTTRYAHDGIAKHASYRLPPVVKGLTHMLVEHQSLVIEALVQENPDLFRKALYAYPLCRSRRQVDAILEGVITANREELPEFIVAARA